MNFNKTTTYAFKVLILMAHNDQEDYTSTYLSEKLNIQMQYLRRLLTDLSKAGFIQSKRGKNGGFIFAKSIKNIFLSDIIDAVEGLEKFNSCMLENHDCNKEGKCSFHDAFGEIKNKMTNALKTTSLFDIKEKSFLI